MIRMYAGGWDATAKDVKGWINNNVEPTAVYASYEEACRNAYHDADVAPDEAIFFVYDDNTIEEFEDW